MKLSDLKPCASCEGPLLLNDHPVYYVIRISHALVRQQHANQLLELSLMLKGSPALVKALGPGAGDGVVILGDKDPRLSSELHICFDCFHSWPLGAILARVNAKAIAATAASGNVNG